jgi:protoheme IX farnesyltransferase
MGSRTAARPVASGRVPAPRALEFGLVLSALSFALLASAVNVLTALLALVGNLFYVVVYTGYLKRSTDQNIVIGGAAGALPPVIGWAAATGEIGLEPLVLFLIIFLWTPPHFWALSLNRADEYARAGVPMLPVVAGRAATTRQILIYSVLLLPISLLPWPLGFAGAIYGAAAAICGVLLVVLAWQLRRAGEADRRAAHRLFAFSIVYLFALFAALLASNGGSRWSSMLSGRAAPTEVGSVVQAESAARPVRTTRSFTGLSADEV